MNGLNEKLSCASFESLNVAINLTGHIRTHSHQDHHIMPCDKNGFVQRLSESLPSGAVVHCTLELALLLYRLAQASHDTIEATCETLSVK